MRKEEGGRRKEDANRDWEEGGGGVKEQRDCKKATGTREGE
jgi:hypothetical protein